MYVGLPVKHRYSCQILMKLEFSGHICKIVLKFHENPSSASHVIPYGKTDMTKLIVPSAIL